MSYEAASQLFWIGVDVVGDSLANHQPDDVWRQAKGAVIHERSMGSGNSGVEPNSSNKVSVVTGTGFHRGDAAGWSRRFEQGFDSLFVGDFLQECRGWLYLRDRECGGRHFVHGCPLRLVQFNR
jgi:hypothetical protein